MPALHAKPSHPPPCKARGLCAALHRPRQKLTVCRCRCAETPGRRNRYPASRYLLSPAPRQPGGKPRAVTPATLQSAKFVCGPIPPVTKVTVLSLQMCGNPRSPKPLPGIALPFVASSPPAGHNRQPDKKPAHRKKRPPKGRPQNKLKPSASRRSARRSCPGRR